MSSIEGSRPVSGRLPKLGDNTAAASVNPQGARVERGAAMDDLHVEPSIVKKEAQTVPQPVVDYIKKWVHDNNNTFTPILGYLDLIKSHDESSWTTVKGYAVEVSTFIQEFRASMQRMHDFIVKGKERLEWSHYSVNHDLLKSLEKEYAEQIKQACLKFDLEPLEEDINLLTDKPVFMAAIGNLLKNAQEAALEIPAAARGDDQHIVLKAEVVKKPSEDTLGSEKTLAITIDNIGEVPEKNLGRLFQEQIDPETTKQGGHGIGTKSVMDGVKSLGGTVAVISDGSLDTGEKVSIRVELPVLNNPPMAETRETLMKDTEFRK